MPTLPHVYLKIRSYLRITRLRLRKWFSTLEADDEA